MSFKDQLNLAKQHNINVCDLTIANEVASFFNINHPRFEEICMVIQRAYLKHEHLSEHDLCCALSRDLQKGEITLENFLKYGDDYDKVIDDACYVGI